MADYVRFMILSDARTGSTMLASALNSSSEIVCFREVFNFALLTINYAVDGYYADSPEDIALRQREPLTFLSQRIYGDHPGHIQAVGFKFLYAHGFGFEGLAKSLQEDTHIRVVHLVRRNVIRSVVSRKIADATGLWGEEAGSDRGRRANVATRLGRALRHPGQTLHRRLQRLASVRNKAVPLSGTNSAGGNPATKVSLTEKECRDMLWHQAWIEEEQDKSYERHPLMTVAYEELVQNPEETLGRVLGFLGVEPRPLAPTTRHQNPQPLSKLIENYDEIREAFRHTEYAWMFEEA